MLTWNGTAETATLQHQEQQSPRDQDARRRAQILAHQEEGHSAEMR